MVDGRHLNPSPFDAGLISSMCHRRLGVGADGLIILEHSDQADFRMRYFNADGKEGSMCGNGGRCITRFAAHLGLIGNETTFEGIDGLHRAAILQNQNISLVLKDVHGIRKLEDGYLLDTGSPHFVQFVSDLDGIDMDQQGREIRNQSRFGSEGVNVNFVSPERGGDQIRVRTFERGVEAETLSCGTGVTAAAIASAVHRQSDNVSYQVTTKGGMLMVSFQRTAKDDFTDVILTGPAVKVYEGSLRL